MIDKGKYASHGAFMKKLPNLGLSHWQKPKHAIIHPIPSTIPRQKNFQFKNRKEDMTIKSNTINTIFKFQQKVDRKPVPQQLIKPFIYIEKLNKKIRTDKKQWDNIIPFVISSKVKQSIVTNSHNPVQNQSGLKHSAVAIPGYNNLFDYQQDKRKTAYKIFKKLYDNNITNIKQVFLMFNKKVNIKDNPHLYIKDKQFLQFMKQLIHDSIPQKQLLHFYQLYNSNQAQDNQNNGKVKQSKRTINNQKDKKQQRVQVNKILTFKGQALSIKAFAFNYEKYLKNQVLITNLMSQKALKQRYFYVKQYLTLFDQHYSQLKQSMNSIKQYQQSIRQHFKSMFNSYQNPYIHQINQLKKQLQKPIIKYDKFKKDSINQKISKLQNENQILYTRIKKEYQEFSQKYQNTIVKNHDLFFNKRTICKLILPLLNRTQNINKIQLNKQIQKVQAQKQIYLQILSGIVIQMDNDKKYLGEDCFTLADLVQMVLMRFNKNKQQNNKQNNSKRPQSSNKNKTNNIININIQLANALKEQQQFTIKSMKKLIKQIKKQYLLKNQLYVQDINLFPADQQIPMQILHTCFQMQCTKVLLKNQIWSQLLNLIPQNEQQSKLHQLTINCNLCLGYLKKYLIKLDQNLTLQRNKSKQISLLIQNANLNNLWFYSEIIQKVNKKIQNFNNDQQDLDYNDSQIHDKVGTLNSNDYKNKDFFGDLAQSVIKNQNNKYLNIEKNLIDNRNNNYSLIIEQKIIAKNIMKSILNQNQNNQKKVKLQEPIETNHSLKISKKQNNKSQIPQSLEALKTLSKSFFVPEDDKKLTTNVFDIRFFQKANQKKPAQNQILRLGTSQLLSNLPMPQQVFSNVKDQLKYSKYIEGNINSHVLETQKLLTQKHYNTQIKQGVNQNYFRDKIKLQNRPTRYDSDGNSKYSVIFPVGYYQGIMVSNQDHNNQKWFLRPHHVETLTQNPLSKKDNIISTQYQSKLDKIPLKKRPDQYVIEANVQRKDNLIQSLQERISSLKQNLQNAQRNKNNNGQKVPNAILNNYLTSITDGKQDKDLQIAAYQAVLYDLRRNERNIVTQYRDGRNKIEGQPQNKWWQKKDSSFNIELKKQRLLVADSLKQNSPHKQYIQKLKNREIY